MLRKLRAHLTYANAMATMAVFIALGGGAYAATQLPKNSVGSRQIKKNAVSSKKVKDGSLLSKDFQAGQLPAGATGPQGAQGPRGPQGPKGDKGDTGPSTGPAGGDLTGNYPNPTIAAGAVSGSKVADHSLTERNLEIYQTRTVDSTTDETVQHYFLHDLNGATSLRVMGAFNGNFEGGGGTLTVKYGGTAVATYTIFPSGGRAWTFLSAPITVGNGGALDVYVRADSADSPVIVRDIDLEF